MMKISFLIPVYNCIDSLRGCVDSIRLAELSDYEILLIDDGSTDGSGALCEQLADRFPEVRAIRQENAGAAAARNRGLEEAAGELLLFADADDTLDSGALGAVLSDPRCMEADLTIFGMTLDHYHRGCCYRRDTLCHGEAGELDWTRSFDVLFRENMLSPLWNKVFRRSIIRRFDLKLDTSLFLYEDLEFVLRYLRCCGTVRNVPSPVYHYRIEEEKAQRRVRRMDSIPQYLLPMEKALSRLPDTVSREPVLHRLHLMLTMQKAAVSDIQEIRRICRDYQRWTENRCCPYEEDTFRDWLLEERVLRLYLHTRMTRIRHRIAVRVKTMRKGMAYGH